MSRGDPEIADHVSAINGVSSRGPNRGYDWPISGAISSPTSGRLKYTKKNDASLSAIRGQKEGPPDWRRAGRDFPRVARKSRTAHWGLEGPSFWALIAAKDSLFLDPFPGRYRADYNVPKMRNPYPRLGAGRRAPLIGGGMAAISPGSSGN